MTSGWANTQSHESVFRIDAEGSGVNDVPDVAATPDGDFIVAWRRDPGNGERPYIAAALVRGWGQVAEPELRVNTARDIDGDGWLDLGRRVRRDPGRYAADLSCVRARR